MKRILFITNFVLLLLFVGCNNQKKVENTDNISGCCEVEKSNCIIIHPELLDNFEDFLKKSYIEELNNIFIFNFYQGKDASFLRMSNGVYIDYEAILQMPFIGYQKYKDFYILVISDFSDNFLNTFINVSELNKNLDDLKILMPPEEDVITNDPEVFLYKIENQTDFILIKHHT